VPLFVLSFAKTTAPLLGRRLDCLVSWSPDDRMAGGTRPEQSISVAEWRTLGGTPEHRQLLTEREVLKRDGSVSTAEQRDGSEQDDKRSQHERCCRAIVQESNGVVGDLVLAKDSGQYFQPRLTPLISAREFQLGQQSQFCD